jgi:hypothetical protein
MDIMYMQYTYMFRYVKVEMSRERKSVMPIMAVDPGFTLGVANLNMIVRRRNLGAAGVDAVV